MTPISRLVSSEQTNPWRRQPPVLKLFSPFAVADHARFFKSWLRRIGNPGDSLLNTPDCLSGTFTFNL
jgi:hypothetical protein